MNGCTNRSKWAIDIPSEASAPVSSRRGTASIDRSRDRLGVGTLTSPFMPSSELPDVAAADRIGVI